MAKSMRSKSKRAFRRTKRETGVYAAADAARLERLSSRLAAKVVAAEADQDGDAHMEEEPEETNTGADAGSSAGAGGPFSDNATTMNVGEGSGGADMDMEQLYGLLGLLDSDALWAGQLRPMWFENPGQYSHGGEENQAGENENETGSGEHHVRRAQH
jgi:hypothetical protein